MAFSHNQKTKLFAAAVVDSMDYVKASKSYMTQGELEGKKYGGTYKIYLADPGTVFDDIDATNHIDSVNEVEVDVTLESKGTAVELNAWNNLNDVESFAKEIAKPRGTKLGLTVQNAVIAKTIGKASQAVVAKPGFAGMSEAAGLLTEAGVAGEKVLFNAPTINGQISATGLANFIPDSIQKDIYGKNYLGEYAGASIMGINGLPSVTGATVSGVTATETAGKIVIAGETEGNKGLPVKIEGLKLIDVNGIKTDNDFVYILGSGVEMRTEGNPNCWIDGELGDVAGMLEAGKTYKMGICRSKDALGFDTYKFQDLPGSINETVNIDGVSVKMSQFGEGKTMKTLTRLDVPFAATVPESRQQVAIFWQID